MYHEPAMFFEVLEYLDVKKDGVYVDLTFGGGGHSKGILEQLGENGKLIAFDQDPDAKNNLIEDERIIFIPQNFRYLKKYLRVYGISQVDGILGDLGVSFHQFDEGQRGFSFRFNSPLDMRMSQKGKSASDWLNEVSIEELTKALKDWGDVNKAYHLANRIKEALAQDTLKTTGDLKIIVEGMFGSHQSAKILSKVFQAIRIGVNEEVTVLEEMLGQLEEVVKVDGRIVFISYHSIEDRLVKNLIKTGNVEGNLNKDFFGNVLKSFEAITRKPIVASKEEVERNPRARSAKLRAALKK